MLFELTSHLSCFLCNLLFGPPQWQKTDTRFHSFITEGLIKLTLTFNLEFKLNVTMGIFALNGCRFDSFGCFMTFTFTCLQAFWDQRRFTKIRIHKLNLIVINWFRFYAQSFFHPLIPWDCTLNCSYRPIIHLWHFYLKWFWRLTSFWIKLFNF